MTSDDLPQSDLLKGADPKAGMAELFTRDMLKLRRETPEDYQRLVQALRDQAERLAAAQAAGEKPPRLARAKKKAADE